jgi:hypothetical protein
MSRDDRWAHLVSAAFRLDESAPLPDEEQRRKLLSVLDSALEVFPAGIEPTEDLEGYAVRRLLLALRARLEATRG